MPATNGSRTSRRSHRTKTNRTNVVTQNTTCWRKLMTCPSRSAASGGSRRPHVAHPLAHIGGDGNERQDGNGGNRRVDQPGEIELQPLLGEDEGRQDDLGGRVGLRYRQRLYRHRLVHE